MNEKEKIIAMSKLLHWILAVLAVMATVLGFMALFAYIWSISGLGGQSYLVEGTRVTLPSFLYIGGTNLFYWSIGEMNAFGFGPEGILRSFFMIASLFMAERMFYQLKKGKTPFSTEVISYFKRFSYALLFLNFATNVVAIVPPLILLAMVHVFEYGRALQEESDHTL